MGLTERHWFEDEEPELTENQLEDILWEQNKIFERGYQKGFSDGKSALLREQEPVLVKHKKVNDEYQAIEDEFVCKHCGAWWMIPEQDLNYCPGCGREVKRE